jgi:hypothetical protein
MDTPTAQVRGIRLKQGFMTAMPGCSINGVPGRVSAARNMIRALRESGAMDADTPAVRQRKFIALVVVLAALGAVAVVAAMLILPHVDLSRIGKGPAAHLNLVKPN